MDTRLSHDRPCPNSAGEIVAECGVTAQPIVEHLDVFKDIPFRFFTHAAPVMVDQLALEPAEESFDAGVVPQFPRHDILTTMPLRACCW